MSDEVLKHVKNVIIQNVVSSYDSKVSAALLMLVSFSTEPWTSTNWRLFLLIYSIVSSYTICK